MRPLRRLSAATLAIGTVLLGAACDGDDDPVSEPDSGEAVSDTGDGSDSDTGGGSPSEDDDPFTEECTLATQEIKNLLDPPDDYLEKEVTSTPADGICEWSSDGYSTDLWVRVKAYDDFYPDESTDKPIPGLGDEAWSNDTSVYWRRDSYSFNVDKVGVTDITDAQLVDIARAVDADVPAE